VERINFPMKIGDKKRKMSEKSEMSVRRKKPGPSVYKLIQEVR